MKLRTWIILLLVALVVAVPLGVLAMGGMLPGLSGVIGSGSARDLGVTATKNDYEHAVSRIEAVTVGKGQVKVDQTFTDAELSALLAYEQEADWPLDSVQIRLHEGGDTELSMRVDKSMIDLSQLPPGPVAQMAKMLPDRVPVYVRGHVAVQGTNQVRLSVEKLEVGRLPLPAGVLGPDVQDLLNEMINEQLLSIPGLKIEALTFGEGTVRLQATAGNK